MARKPTKAADNVYCIARLEAAKGNDRLSSREGAAEVCGIDRTRLARIELGSLTPYPEEVQLLADIYKAPHLLYNHCSNDCPIGKITMQEVELKELTHLTCELHDLLDNVPWMQKNLISVAKDRIISPSELPIVDKILALLDEMNQGRIALSILRENTMNGVDAGE